MVVNKFTKYLDLTTKTKNKGDKRLCKIMICINYELLNKLKKVNGIIKVGNENVIDFKDLYDMYKLYIMLIKTCLPIEYELFIYCLLETMKYKVIAKKIVISIQDLKKSNTRYLLYKIHNKGVSYLDKINKQK